MHIQLIKQLRYTTLFLVGVLLLVFTCNAIGTKKKVTAEETSVYELVQDVDNDLEVDLDLIPFVATQNFLFQYSFSAADISTTTSISHATKHLPEGRLYILFSKLKTDIA